MGAPPLQDYDEAEGASPVHAGAAEAANKGFKKRAWTPSEDGILRESVSSNGAKDWNYISSLLTERSAKQCCERWHNYLKPDIRRDAWRPEEDKVILEFHRAFCNKWSKIAELLPGRTGNSVKNRYYCLLRRDKRNASVSKGRSLQHAEGDRAAAQVQRDQMYLPRDRGPPHEIFSHQQGGCLPPSPKAVQSLQMQAQQQHGYFGLSNSAFPAQDVARSLQSLGGRDSGRTPGGLSTSESLASFSAPHSSQQHPPFTTRQYHAENKAGGIEEGFPSGHAWDPSWGQSTAAPSLDVSRSQQSHHQPIPAPGHYNLSNAQAHGGNAASFQNQAYYSSTGQGLGPMPNVLPPFPPGPQAMLNFSAASRPGGGYQGAQGHTGSEEGKVPSTSMYAMHSAGSGMGVHGGNHQGTGAITDIRCPSSGGAQRPPLPGGSNAGGEQHPSFLFQSMHSASMASPALHGCNESEGGHEIPRQGEGLRQEERMGSHVDEMQDTLYGSNRGQSISNAQAGEGPGRDPPGGTDGYTVV